MGGGDLDGDGNIDVAISFENTTVATDLSGGGYRSLEDIAFDLGDENNTSNEPNLMFLKCVVILLGVSLALSIHVFKMIMRVIGLACSNGCCSPCLTIVENTIAVIGVFLAVFLQPIAVVMTVLLLLAAVFAIHRKCIQKRDENKDSDNSVDKKNEKDIDVEERGIEIATTNSINPPLAEAVPF